GRAGHARLRGRRGRLLPVSAVGEPTQPGPTAPVVAGGLGGHPGAAAGVAPRRRGAAGRVGSRGVRGGRGLDRHRGWAAGGLDGAALAGALAGVRAGPGGSPGAPAGQSRGGLARPAGAQAGEEATLSRGTAACSGSHRSPRRGGRLAALYGGSAHDDAAGPSVSGPTRATGGGSVLRGRGVPGRLTVRGDEPSVWPAGRPDR